jgi:hypothetical protein
MRCDKIETLWVKGENFTNGDRRRAAYRSVSCKRRAGGGKAPISNIYATNGEINGPARNA